MKMLKIKGSGLFSAFTSTPWSQIVDAFKLNGPEPDLEESQKEYRKQILKDVERLSGDSKVVPLVGRLVQLALMNAWKYNKGRLALLPGKFIVHHRPSEDQMLPPPPIPKNGFSMKDRDGDGAIDIEPDMMPINVKFGCLDRNVQVFTTKRLTIVVMLGGATWDQIAAVRRARVNAQKPVVVVTTSIREKERLVRSLCLEWKMPA